MERQDFLVIVDSWENVQRETAAILQRTKRQMMNRSFNYARFPFHYR